MNHYLRAFVISFFLTGCGNHLVFEPNKLPDGYIDQEYYVPITISGGTGPVVDLSYEIHPSNSGLKLVFSEKNITQGKPQLQGIVKINIRGGVVASAGQYFEKQYEINIQK